MITEEELKENGFVHTDDWNNRSYYEKGDFEMYQFCEFIKSKLYEDNRK